MDMRTIIAARRDGNSHSEADLRHLAFGAASGSIPDYQLAAWLMAAVLRPLSVEETAWLTVAMADSGLRFDLSGIPEPWVDKHSTGGVGDKTTIVLLPLLASCGLSMLKLSGRGLGITGGTVDKLESVPGFRMDLAPEAMRAQVERIGLAISGQTAQLAPADKVLYALRDATATVASVPLIASSILSKKLAGGAKVIVIDLKCGSGAFMQTRRQAEELAGWMQQVAERCGLRIAIAITEMNQPLGRAVGNVLEVLEAVETLKGALGRFRELCLDLAGIALKAAGKASDRTEGRLLAQEALDSGRALKKARDWFAAQGASVDAFDGVNWNPAPVVRVVRHDGAEAWVATIDARVIGEAALALGAGRLRKDDVIDPRVGIVLGVEAGDRVRAGDELALVHAADETSAALAEASIRSAFALAEAPTTPGPLVLDVLGDSLPG